MEKYFSKTTEEALNYLKVSKEGLSTRQAKENLSTYGFNELNQKKNNVVLGGIGWLKMGGRNIQTAIDLSALGLDKIEEDEECFKIGCMCTLRQLETNESLNSYFNGIIAVIGL